jgi:hypothetical protein
METLSSVHQTERCMGQLWLATWMDLVAGNLDGFGGWQLGWISWLATWIDLVAGHLDGFGGWQLGWIWWLATWMDLVAGNLH